MNFLCANCIAPSVAILFARDTRLIGVKALNFFMQIVCNTCTDFALVCLSEVFLVSFFVSATLRQYIILTDKVYALRFRL